VKLLDWLRSFCSNSLAFVRIGCVLTKKRYHSTYTLAGFDLTIHNSAGQDNHAVEATKKLFKVSMGILKLNIQRLDQIK
jgi:hypothetical protein